MHIVYLHGFNGSRNGWNHLHSCLPHHKSTFIEYDSHQCLNCSLQQIKKKLPQQPFSIVGHSLGGVLGTLLAYETKNIRNLIVISAPLAGTCSARFFRWIPGHPRIIDDLVPEENHFQKIKSKKLDVPALSIISTAGHNYFLTPIEKNDGVVSLRSQRALEFGIKVEIEANHFSVLEHERTASVVQSFLFGETLYD